MITVSQFYAPLKVGFTFTYVAPLAFILMVSLGKEAYDDCKRRETDKKDNTSMYRKLMDDTGRTEEIMAQEMQVGDIIEVV